MSISNYPFETAPRLVGDLIEQNKSSLFHFFSTMLDGVPDIFAGRMIVFPDFYHYAAAYFKDKAMAGEIADEYIDKRGYRPPVMDGDGTLVIGGIFNRLADSDGPDSHLNTDGVRSSRSYPLTAEQVRLAAGFMADNPAYVRGVAALQGCLASYMGDLMRLVGAQAGKDRVSQFIIAKLDHEFTKNADGFGFGNFAVAMAAMLAANREKQYPDAVDRKYLPQLFSMHAFKSSATLAGNIADARFCPFSSNFAKVLSMKLTEREDGTINVSPGDFGQSISSLIKILPVDSGPDHAAPLSGPGLRIKG